MVNRREGSPPAEQMSFGDVAPGPSTATSTGTSTGADATATGSERLLLVPHGPAARDELWRLVRAAKHDDPLAAVTVAVPSPYAGLSLRRELGQRDGLVNVRFLALARVAELLAAPVLASTHRGPLTAPLRDEAVHAVLTAEPGPFAAVADHPSTTRGLAATFTDLRRAPASAATSAARHGERAAAVARLYAMFRDRTSEYYDEEELLEAAAGVVAEDGAALTELGQLIVFLPAALTPGELALVGALARHGRATVVLGLTGNDKVDALQGEALAARLAGALGPAARAEPSPVPVGTMIVSAPDPEDEVRAVARLLLARAADGEPLSDLAVLYRIDAPYARLVPEVFDAAGIAWNGPSPRRLSDAVVARVLLGLLDLAATDLARDEVAAWLAAGPIIDPADNRRVPSARWDIVSREAGVVASADQWSNRLARHLAELAGALHEGQAKGDLSDGRVRALESDIETVGRLRDFIADLADQLLPPDVTTWAAHATWATALVDRYVGSEGRRNDWPDVELEAGRRVVAVLDGLGALDVLGAPVDAGRFRRALAAELDAPFGRVATFGTGVLVAPLRNAYATRHRAVYMLGMVEGSFPPRGREDPLLPDRVRLAAGDLPVHAHHSAEERRDYFAALSSAPERVLCFPRGDARAQRRRLPARLLLDSAAELAGERLTAETLQSHAGASWLHTVESFRQLVTGDAEPGSITEYDVRSLVRWNDAGLTLIDHPLAHGPFGAGLDAMVARASSHLTPYDGNVGAGYGLAPTDQRLVSPTALQDWATCPLRYLLSRVLRVREVPKPEATDTISALEKGTLIHKILERFVQESRTRTDPTEPWDSADRALLDRIANECCDEAEQRGITGRPLEWRLARRGIMRTAYSFLATDEAVRAVLGVQPHGVEVAFGFDDSPPVSVTLGDGRQVAFRGRIDRIDRSSDGARTVVFDYKTGTRPRTDDDPVAGGTSLQLPVYAHAAEALDPTTRASAFYWYTASEAKDALVGHDLDDCRERFTDVVTTIVDGIDAGCFPAYPGEPRWQPNERRDSFHNCGYCPYDRLCPADRFSAWERTIGDDAVAPFLALDLPDDDQSDDDQPDDDQPDGEATG
jgi:RecB family exonuclease